MRSLLPSLIFLLWVTSTVRLYSQPEQYKFGRVDLQQGLSNSQAKCVFKNTKGFIWIGTSSGLNRFDGYSVKVYQNDAGDTSSIHDNDINELFEDPDENLWISTWTGLGYYNPRTELFSRNTNALLRKFGIAEGLIKTIYKDHQGNFWFVHASEGLFKYAPPTKSVLRISHVDTDSTSIISNEVSVIEEGRDGDYWVIHKSGILEKLDGRTGKVQFRSRALTKIIREETPEFHLTIDSDNDLWIYVSNYNKGVVYFKSSTKAFAQINTTSSPWRLNTDIVHGIVQDSKGLIWVGTDHGGINLLDKKKSTVHFILNNPEDDKSLGQNSISSLYMDPDGFIWAGTFKKGVYYFHEYATRFSLFRHLASDKSSVPFNDINAFAEDKKGNLWIGTNGAGLIYYDRQTHNYTEYVNKPGDPNSLSSNVIVSLFVDRDGKLWIGTYFGGLNCFDGKKFTRYNADPGNPRSLGDNSVWEIFEDSHRNLWIGTHSKGVDLFDRDKGTFVHYRNGDVNAVPSTYIPAFMEDKSGNIWIGTGYGIYILEKHSGRIMQYLNQAGNPNSLSNNNVISLMEDSYGKVWIGSKEGLNLFDPKTKVFRAFGIRDGLPHNTILTLLEDSYKNIWIGTPNGLSNMVMVRDAAGEPISFSFRNYDESDGLQGKQFNENSAIMTSKGEMIFGGSNGFNIFRPHDIVQNERKARVILTDLSVFNKPLKIGDEVNGRVMLQRSLAETDEIILRHSDNVFSLEFAGLTYFNPQKIRYKYMLEGFNREWVETDASQRRVTYTNLDPGHYTFKVIAANNDGLWNDTPTQLAITVLPPFWKTKAAFLVYVILILVALFLSRRLILARERMKYRIRQERQEALQVHELDMMKLRFFTNVSHEFRTPLTLILAPVEKILKNTADPDQRKQFELIHRNARRLLNLVNQLLDFRKMDVQQINLNPSEGDVIGFIKDSSYSFKDLSEKKNISFTFQSKVEAFETVFDKDKLEKIIFNLLSNAFKFTPDNGHVSVHVDILQEGEIRKLLLKVSDTGIGIPPDQQDKVFERFFQREVPNMVTQGSGIGLSITREFVKLHGGTIFVESEIDKGSTFSVIIPLEPINGDRVMSPPDVDGVVEELQSFNDEATETDENTPGKPVLLLIEDNEDFRYYLKDNLKGQYRVLEASNGKTGLKQALEHIPDLIVSDVMMPEMNGIDLCRTIKNEKTTSHIPVILLTARSAEEQKMEGFESGADDYITKPFNFEILQSRIRNLVHQRELFHKEFKKLIQVKASDLNITSLDEKLIQNAIKCVEKNLADADFSVVDLSRELAMSRVHLYKKLHALTGKSPLEFIRTIRLQHAAQLLKKSQLSVSEIAYKVGFNNPKYFARYFKEEYHVLPSAYAAVKGEENE